MIDESRLLAARLLAASPSAMSLEEALEHIRARRAELLAQPQPSRASDPDFTAPEPMPLVTAPEKFAENFWNKRKLPGPDDDPPKRKPKKPRPGRRPVGNLDARHDALRVVDGDKQK